MCGIVGFTSFREHRIDAHHTIQAMNRALTHRGPDEEGAFIEGPIALGSRRLSIIDLVGGKMPIHNEDRSLWIVFNGEIYNFPELREQLLEKGHTFSTHTDTEVIVHLYEEYGVECLAKLNGMFAIALWDKVRQRLFLARDRLGIKPLHYVEYPGGIVFASEIKALLQHPCCESQLDVHGLRKYLSYEYVPAPHSILKNIKKLEAGHYLLHSRGKTVTQRYWDISLESREHSGIQGEELAGELLAHLKDSVQKRLISDVPIGILLSGGIDSSTVAVLASQCAPDAIHSFSIGFDEPSFDESSYARNIARAIGSKHHHQILSSRKMLEIIPDIFNTLDEPLADASIIPTYLLSKMTSQHVKVALGGDGADELFAGYSLHQAYKLLRYYDKFPQTFREILRRIVSRLPVSHKDMSFDFKLKQFLRGTGVAPEIGFFHWRSAFLEQEQQAILSQEIRHECFAAHSPFEEIGQFLFENSRLGEFERILSLGMTLYLQDDILSKVDRASMAHSLEVRVPFLDHRVVEFAAGLPSSYKLHGFTGKYLLKKAVKHLLPKEILQRKKKGFGVPLAKWFNGPLQEMLLSYLNEERIKKAGIFEYAEIKRLLDGHFTYAQNNRKQLWTLLVFEMWREQFLK